MSTLLDALFPCETCVRCVSTSLTPRPLTVRGLWSENETLSEHVYKRKWVLRNGQQPSSDINSLIDQDEFEAMKMHSSCRAPFCDNHQFCAKIVVIT